MSVPHGAVYVLGGGDLGVARGAAGPFREAGRPAWLDDEQALKELGEKHKEIIAYYDSDADELAYFHVRDRVIVRELRVHDKKWVVRGEPDPWEEACFFGFGTLEEILADIHDDVEESELGEIEAEVRSIWEAKRLSSGSRFPTPRHRRIAQAFCEHYGLGPPPTSMGL